MQQEDIPQKSINDQSIEMNQAQVAVIILGCR